MLFSEALDNTIAATLTNARVLGEGSSPNSGSSSPEDSDDFVLVPSNLPVDQQIVNYERK